MADYTPVNRNGTDPFSMTTSAAVTGGQVLVVTGANTCGPAAGASGLLAGVAGADAASGSRVTVWPIPGVVHESVNANVGALAAGDALSSAASGQVDKGTLATLAAAGTLAGIALTAAASGAKVTWIGR